MSTCNSLPAIPWKEQLVGDSETVWCHRGQLIIPQNPIPSYTDTDSIPAFSRLKDLLPLLKQFAPVKGGDKRLSSAKFKYFISKKVPGI